MPFSRTAEPGEGVPRRDQVQAHLATGRLLKGLAELCACGSRADFPTRKSANARVRSEADHLLS